MNQLIVLNGRTQGPSWQAKVTIKGCYPVIHRHTQPAIWHRATSKPGTQPVLDSKLAPALKLPWCPQVDGPLQSIYVQTWGYRSGCRHACMGQRLTTTRDWGVRSSYGAVCLGWISPFNCFKGNLSSYDLCSCLELSGLQINPKSMPQLLGRPDAMTSASFWSTIAHH